MKKRIAKKIQKRSGNADNLSYRSFELRIEGPESLNEDNRSVEAIIATEQPVEIFDFERYEIINEILLIDGVELPGNRQIPLLDSHQRFDTASVLGSIRSLKKDGDKLIGRATFSKVADVEDVWQKVREGHLTDFSAGYRPIDSQWVPEGESYSYKGRSFAGPVRVTKRWRIREGSIVPIGADALAKARAANDENQKPENKGAKMDPRLKKYLISRGLSEDASDADAWTFLAELEKRDEKQKTETKADDKKVDDSKRQEKPVDAETHRKEATGQERDRIREIDALGRRWENQKLADKLIEDGASIVEAYRQFDDYLDKSRDDKIVHFQPATITAEAGDKFRAAATDSLLMRSNVPNIQPEKPAQGFDDLMGYSLKELAREALRVGNLNVKGNSMEMVGRALSISDLPYILANVANKSLFSGWDTAPETWRAWVATDQVSDFKTHYSPRLSEISDLEEIPESGEYRYGELAEAQESYSIAKYGKLFAVTREMIINDDLGALTRIPAMHGEAASRKVADVVYAVLTANAAMGDGTALFHADHGNLVAGGSGAAPGTDTIAAMILAMKLQTDIQGLRRLGIRPEFVIMPVALEGAAEVFFQTIQYTDSGTIGTPDEAYATTRKNIYSGSYFTRVYEPRLDDSDPAAWFGAGPRGKTVVAFFLNGVQTPYLENRQGWSVDGTEYKVRIEVGAKAMDWRGLYMNDGN